MTDNSNTPGPVQTGPESDPNERGKWKIDQVWEAQEHVLYARFTPNPGRVMIGMLRNPALAQHICDLHNAARETSPPSPDPVRVSYTGPDGEPQTAALPPPFRPLLDAYAGAQAAAVRVRTLRAAAGVLAGPSGDEPERAPVTAPGDQGPSLPSGVSVPAAGVYVPAAERRANTAKVRAWARTHGWPDLKTHGRIPEGARMAYDQAHAGGN